VGVFESDSKKKEKNLGSFRREENKNKRIRENIENVELVEPCVGRWDGELTTGNSKKTKGG